MSKARVVQQTLNTSEKASEYPSGRGHSGGSAGSHRIDNPDRRTGMLPQHNPSANGGPSSSPDVNASEIMQNMIMNDDDKEWYKELFKKQSKDFLKPRFSVGSGFEVGLNCGLSPEITLSECLGCAVNLCRKHLSESKDILLGPDSVKKKKKKNESNSVGGGNVAGYTGEDKTLKARKKNAKINARAFGGGKVVGKY